MILQLLIHFTTIRVDGHSSSHPHIQLTKMSFQGLIIQTEWINSFFSFLQLHLKEWQNSEWGCYLNILNWLMQFFSISSKVTVFIVSCLGLAVILSPSKVVCWFRIVGTTADLIAPQPSDARQSEVNEYSLFFVCLFVCFFSRAHMHSNHPFKEAASACTSYSRA